MPRQLQCTEKVCRRCNTLKPITEYSLSRKATETQRQVYRSECKPCNSKIAAKWAKENPEQHAATKHRYTLEKTYGITIEQYNEMLIVQGGVCAVCKLDEPNAHGRTGTKFRLSVDHCHDSGKVRGLLCQKCNRAIGLLGDSVELLRKAIDYLEGE